MAHAFALGSGKPGNIGYDRLLHVIANGDVAVFNDTAAAVDALRRSRIDGVVVDLPTAFQLAAAEIPDGVIVGQLPAPDAGTTDDFAILLADRSPLTSCTSLAVDSLRKDGTLATLEARWLGADVATPVFR